MSKYTYQKKYTSPTEYKIIQLRSDKNRTVSEDHADYLLYLLEGNQPEVIAYVPPVEPTLEEMKASKIAMLKMNMRMHIESVYPDYKQRSAALGVYGEEKRQEIAAFLSAKITIVNDLEAQIIAATSKGDLEIIEITVNS